MFVGLRSRWNILVGSVSSGRVRTGPRFRGAKCVPQETDVKAGLGSDKNVYLAPIGYMRERLARRVRAPIRPEPRVTLSSGAFARAWFREEQRDVE
jgi:hypothetical protein